MKWYRGEGSGKVEVEAVREGKGRKRMKSTGGREREETREKG